MIQTRHNFVNRPGFSPNLAKQDTKLTPEELEEHANPTIMEDPANVRLLSTDYRSNGAQGHYVQANAELESADGKKQFIELRWPFKAFKPKGDKTLQLRTKQEKPRPMTVGEAKVQEHSENFRLANAKTAQAVKVQTATNDTLRKMNDENRKMSSVRKVEASELPKELQTALLRRLAHKNPTHTSDKKDRGERVSPLQAVQTELKELKRVLETA